VEVGRKIGPPEREVVCQRGTSSPRLMGPTAWAIRAARRGDARASRRRRPSGAHRPEAGVLVEAACRRIVGCHPAGHEVRAARAERGDHCPDELARDPPPARLGPDVDLGELADPQPPHHAAGESGTAPCSSAITAEPELTAVSIPARVPTRAPSTQDGTGDSRSTHSSVRARRPRGRGCGGSPRAGRAAGTRRSGCRAERSSGRR
jgi:hypothetical protein